MNYSDLRKRYGLKALNEVEYLSRNNNKYYDSRTYQDKDGNYHVHPIFKDTNTGFIVCPHCGDIHSHGVTNEGFTGSRISHCNTGGLNGYILEDDENLFVKLCNHYKKAVTDPDVEIKEYHGIV